MIVQFETAVPDDPGAALARAEALLRRYGFVREAEREGVYVRASRWGTGGGVYPRQVRATLGLEIGDGCAREVLRTDPLRGPVSALDRHVWRGEMDDLRAAIEGVPGPGLDRARENTAAGAFTAITVVVVLVLFAIGFSVRGSLGIALTVLGAVVPLLLYIVLPLRMPSYPVAETPADLSNYPR